MQADTHRHACGQTRRHALTQICRDRHARMSYVAYLFATIVPPSLPQDPSDSEATQHGQDWQQRGHTWQEAPRGFWAN